MVGFRVVGRQFGEKEIYLVPVRAAADVADKSAVPDYLLTTDGRRGDLIAAFICHVYGRNSYGRNT